MQNELGQVADPLTKGSLPPPKLWPTAKALLVMITTELNKAQQTTTT
jgi:hypothetical protein